MKLERPIMATLKSTVARRKAAKAKKGAKLSIYKGAGGAIGMAKLRKQGMIGPGTGRSSTTGGDG